MEKEAVVRARLDGVDEVTRGAQKISSAWQEAGGAIGKSFKGAAGAVGEAVTGMISDIGHVVTAAGAISFAGSIQQVHQLEESVARMGVSSGRSVRSTQDAINDLSGQINEMPNATAEWISSVGKLTYSYEHAAQAAKGAESFGALTGRSLNEVAPLAVAIEQTAGAGSNLGKTLGVLVSQANALKSAGGPAALADMFMHLQGQVSMLNGDEGLAKTTALMAGFGGPKGFTPQQRERAFGGVLGKLEGDPEGFERFLGHKITDEFGHINDVTGVMRELSDYAKKGAGQRLRSELTFGKEATAALIHTDFGAIRDAEKLGPAATMDEALARLKGTPAGERKAAQVQKAITMQDVVGSGSLIGDFSDWIGQQAASHPVLTGVGAALGTKLLGVGAKAMMGAFGGGAEVAAASAGGAAGGSAAGGGLAAGAGLSGMAALGLIGGGVAAQFAVLSELGAASKAKQGFASKDLGYKEAEQLAARAGSADAEAAQHRSSGMQAAMQAEQQRLERERQARLPTAAQALAQAPGGEAQFKALVDQLTKMGASLALAQQTAAQMLIKGAGPVQIEIIDATSSKVDAHIRGQQ